jgi:hypothetical protein
MGWWQKNPVRRQISNGRREQVGTSWRCVGLWLLKNLHIFAWFDVNHVNSGW